MMSSGLHVDARIYDTIIEYDLCNVFISFKFIDMEKRNESGIMGSLFMN